jgi:hypothetical protein
MPGAVAQMVSGQGFSAFPRRGRADLFPGSGGCELVAVDFEQVVDGAHELPLT